MTSGFLLVALLGCAGETGDDTATSATTGKLSDSTSSAPTVTTLGWDTNSSGGTEGEPPIDCDAICARTWVYDGDLPFVDPDFDLSGFACMEEVTGVLAIHDFSGPLPSELLSLRRAGVLSITRSLSVSGLDCMETVSQLVVVDNEELLDLSPLDGITAKSTLVISGNHSIEDASAISIGDGETMDMVIISGNDALITLPEVTPGTPVQQLEIQHNKLLTDLDGLHNLHMVSINESDGSVLMVIDNPAMGDVSALSEIIPPTAPFLRVWLGQLPALDTINGLDNLRTAQWLSLFDLPLVDHLGPLDALEELGSLSISDMPLLESLDGVGNSMNLDTLLLGQCTQKGVQFTGIYGGNGIASLGHLELGSNPNLGTFADFAPAGLESVRSAYNPMLAPETLGTYCAELGVNDCCSQPPENCSCR